MYLSDGSVASTAMAKLEELETKLSEAQLKAEPRLKTRLDLVLREKELAEALAEVTKAARLKLDLAPGAVSDARRLAGSRLLHVTYLDLRRYTAAQALDALCGPACLDWSADGARLTVTSARRGETPAPWTYDVATLAIPEPKELGEGKDYQKTTAAAGAAAAEFLAAARKAVGAKEDEDCFWLAPGQLVVFGDREVQARMTKFIAALEAGEGELGKKALARQTARKDLAAKAEEAIEKQEVYGVLQGASWRLLAAAAGGERDLEALAWLEHAWSRAFAKELAGAKTPLTALRSAWTASEAALALPKDKELGALAKTALAEADKSADAALAALDKEKENAGAYLATLYATLALRNGQELGLVKKARVKEFNAKALPLLTGKAAKSPLEPLRLAARTLLEQDAPDAKELAGLFKQRLYGDDLTALVALAARKAGAESWLAFRAEARERLRESGASGPVVLLASRLSKPLLPSAR